MPRAIDEALGKAGATRLTAFAFGDADSTMEESFEEWKFALWEGLSKGLGICKSVPLGYRVRPPISSSGLPSLLHTDPNPN